MNKEIEKKLLLYGSDKYPKSGLIDSMVNKLERIGFMGTKEISAENSIYGSIWLGCGTLLAVKRTSPSANDSHLKLKLFDNSTDAESWLLKK